MIKSRSFSASFFTSNFGRHFERILMDFGAHFHDFWTPKSSLNPKRRKYEKPMFYLRKTYVFEGPGLSFLVEKSIKNDVGTRCGIGTDFFMIFGRFWPPFWSPKSIKNQQKDGIEIGLEFGDGNVTKKEDVGRLAPGWRQGRRSLEPKNSESSMKNSGTPRPRRGRRI